MQKTAQQIFEESAETCALLEVHGNKEVVITAIAAYQKGKKGDLVFVPNSKALHQAIENEVSAIVHESVTIPENTSLGPEVVIEQGAKIGWHCLIMVNVVIEHDAVIGNHVEIPLIHVNQRNLFVNPLQSNYVYFCNDGGVFRYDVGEEEFEYLSDEWVRY